MALCEKCRRFYPPNFVEKKRGSDLCIWCNRETEYISYVENGVKRSVTKEEVAKEYKKFLAELKDRKNVKELLGSD